MKSTQLQQKTSPSPVPNLSITISTPKKSEKEKRLVLFSDNNDVKVIQLDSKLQSDNQTKSRQVNQQQSSKKADNLTTSITMNSQQKVISIPQRTTKDQSFLQNSSQLKTYDASNTSNINHSQINSSSMINGQSQFNIEHEKSSMKNAIAKMIGGNINNSSKPLVGHQSRITQKPKTGLKSNKNQLAATQKFGSKTPTNQLQTYYMSQLNGSQAKSQLNHNGAQTSKNQTAVNQFQISLSSSTEDQKEKMSTTSSKNYHNQSIDKKITSSFTQNSKNKNQPTRLNQKVQKIVNMNTLDRAGSKTPKQEFKSQGSTNIIQQSPNVIQFQSARTKSQQVEESKKPIHTISLKIDPQFFSQVDAQSSIQQINDMSPQSKTPNIFETQNYQASQHFSVNFEEEYDNKAKTQEQYNRTVNNFQDEVLCNINTFRGEATQIQETKPEFSPSPKRRSNSRKQENQDAKEIQVYTPFVMDFQANHDSTTILGLSKINNANDVRQNMLVDDTLEEYKELQMQYQEDDQFTNKISDRRCYMCSIKTNEERKDDITSIQNTQKVSRQTSPVRSFINNGKQSRQTSITPRRSSSSSPKKDNVSTSPQVRRRYSRSPTKKPEVSEIALQTQEFELEQKDQNILINDSFNGISMNQSPSRNNLMRIQSPDLQTNSSPIQQQNKQIDDLLQQSFTSQAPMNNDYIENIAKFLQNKEGNISQQMDREKVNIIQKYESLLQKIVFEYSKLQQKHDDLQHQLMNDSRSVHTQFQVINTKDQMLKQMQVRISELEHKNQVCNKEIQNLRNKIQTEQDTNFAEKKHLELAKQQLINQVQQLQDTEVTLRSRNSQIQEDNHQMEHQVKQLREQALKIETEKRVFEHELMKMRSQEQNITQEIMRVKQVYQDMDFKCSDYRQQLEGLVQTLKKKDLDIEQIQWESQGLKSTIEILQSNQQAILHKNNQLKEELNRLHIERQALQVQNEQQSAMKQNRDQFQLNNLIQPLVGSNVNNSYEFDFQNNNKMQNIRMQLSPKPTHLSSSNQMNDYYSQLSPKRIVEVRLDDVSPTNNMMTVETSLEASIQKYLPKHSPTHQNRRNKKNDLNNSVITSSSKLYDKRFQTNDSSSINQVFKWPDLKSATQQNSLRGSANFSSFNGPMTTQIYPHGSAVKRQQIDLSGIVIGNNYSITKNSNSTGQESLSARVMGGVNNSSRVNTHQAYSLHHPPVISTTHQAQQRSLSLNSDIVESMPAAGKRSGLTMKMHQSQQNMTQVVNQLQNAMIEQLLQKTQLESDLKEIALNQSLGGAVKSNNHRDILEKKLEIEVNLDIISKNIQNLKDKIKSLDS
eukprot:403361952